MTTLEEIFLKLGEEEESKKEELELRVRLFVDFGKSGTALNISRIKRRRIRRTRRMSNKMASAIKTW